MKLLFVANNLSKGGIQTSLLNLLKVIAQNPKYTIDLFLFSDKMQAIDEIPKNVTVIRGNYFLQLTAISLKEVIYTKNIINIILRILLMIIVRILSPKLYFRVLFKMHKNNKKYDYAVSYFNDIPNTYFNRGATQYVLENCNATKKVGWFHTDIEKAGFDLKYYEKEYSKFDYIINVSNYTKKVYDRLIPSQKEKTTIIYNFFPIEEIKNKAMEKINLPLDEKNKKIFVTVARIDNKSKRIDRIIETVKILINKNINDFKWYILGDGPDSEWIKEQIKQYGLEKNIVILGEIKNPYPYMKKAHLFILTSDFEGYPMVIKESLCVGTPVLVTAYESAQEQIRQKYDGIIVEKSAEALAETLEKLINEPYIIEKMSKNIKKEQISNEESIKQFDKIFGEV